MKYAIFSSVGDNKTFLNFYYDHLSCCDLFINFHGSNDRIYSIIKKYSKHISRIHTTKFPALKNIYNISNLSMYDYVFVFDDDCIVEYGDLCTIPILMEKYKMDIAAPCQSNSGKISHDITRHHSGNHIFRYTNFVEMNFPVFSQEGLKKYMSVYDGKLCGWGNDWWYLNTMSSFEQKNCGIIDNICVKNPYEHEKNFASIDDIMNRRDRAYQWEETRNRLNLNEWSQKNLEFIWA